MIFVITGTESFPFNRLIEHIDLLKMNGMITDEVFIQLGSCSYIPSSCNWQQWLSFGAMRDNIINSDIIISHAGVGTTLLCLELGKRPIIIARRKKYGEHVDDHQAEFAHLMSGNGHAIVASNIEDLELCIASVDAKKNSEYKLNNKNELISYLENWLIE